MMCWSSYITWLPDDGHRNLSKYLKTIAILLQVHQLIHSSPHVGLVSFIFTVCKTKTFLSSLLSLYFLCSCWVLSEGHIPASYISVKGVQSIFQTLSETHKTWGRESTSFYRMLLIVLQICWRGWPILTGCPGKSILWKSKRAAKIPC